MKKYIPYEKKVKDMNTHKIYEFELAYELNKIKFKL